MVWSRVHVLYSSLLNLYLPLIAEMLVSALQSFLNLGTLQQRSFYTVTGILGTLLYSLSWSSNQCMWLRDSAVIVYILCSGSYLADQTCNCACMFTSLHVAPVPLKVHGFTQLCYRQRGETKQASKLHVQTFSCVAIPLQSLGLHGDTYQKQLLHSSSSACMLWLDLNELAITLGLKLPFCFCIQWYIAEEE